MSDPIDLPLDDDDRLAEPPLVDSLHYERGADGFSITFVPSVGDEPTRSIFIPRDSVEGRRVTTYFYRIQELVGNRVERVVHSGGGDYTLRLANGESRRLSGEAPDASWASEVFDRLKQIAGESETFSTLHAGHR
jgi:hypothetical protein